MIMIDAHGTVMHMYNHTVMNLIISCNIMQSRSICLYIFYINITMILKLITLESSIDRCAFQYIITLMKINNTVSYKINVRSEDQKL